MKELAIIGMGTMGSAIHELLQGDFAVRGFRRGNNLADVGTSDIAVIAVKPQSFTDLAEELRPHIDRQTVISIMAGVTVQRLTESLGTERVVRSMPNLPLKIGRSATGWYTESDSIDLPTTQGIFDSWGWSLRLEREDQFHDFTAVVGSGPAYVAILAEQLIRVGADHGLDSTDITNATIQMLDGTIELLKASRDPVALRQGVTSKGGTTAAALNALEQGGFNGMVEAAVTAAAERSRELGG